MATSCEEDVSSSSDENTLAISCFMCISPSKKCRMTAFSVKTWTRFLEYVIKWKDLDGPQAQIARDFADENSAAVAGLGTSAAIPQHGGYHTTCYARFTDSQRIERTTKNMRKKADAAASTATTSQLNDERNISESPEPARKRRALRSSMGRPPVPARSKHVLPNICILCQREKTLVCKITGKRKKEHLVKCSTIEAANLQKAAEDSGNESLLMQIRGQDCVAIEVRYHTSCYRDFTRYLTKPSKAEGRSDTSYSQAFEVFSKTVETRIIENKEIMRLKKLNDLFVKQIKETDGVDATAYKTSYLKQRLLKTFPQLCFITPHMRSQGDIVYVNDIPTSTLVEERKLLEEVTQSSETDSTTDSNAPPAQVQKEKPYRYMHKDPNQLVNSYNTALELRTAIKEVKPSLPWPPTAENLNLEEVERTVPCMLFNFLAWMVGASEEPDTDNKVDVAAKLHRKLLSISQDIISLAFDGRRLMPKHLSLAMAVRHMCGSAQLVGLLNGFGHSVSHSVVLNHDTALAAQEISRGENSLPSTILPGIPTTLVWDNNDFGEETLSGRGTTHNTNGIIVQNNVESSASSSSTDPGTRMKRSRQRSLQPPEVNLDTFYGGRREGPTPFAEHVSLLQSSNVPLLQNPLKVDLAYYITKFSTERILPSWTGFNQLLSQVEVPPKSKVGYLPVIDSSPTEMDTVLTILNRSVDIADKLKLETVVIVMDQAIYSKAQLIRWRNAQFMKRLVIRLGAFHTAMSYLGCLGKRFRDAGFQDILIESEVVATGSINGVMTGKHYNRAVRAHKLVAESMQQMRVSAYLKTISDEEGERVKHLMNSMSKSFPGEKYQEIINGETFCQFQTSFKEFVEAGSKKPTFGFWSSYINMVEILLLFLRGTRGANWQLHLASVRCMLPWVFAYDQINYSRYLPVYWLEMSNLESTHPAIHQQCTTGDFAVQRSTNAFAKVACDQTIEQTANRDSKSKGGMTGFTTSKGAVNRWIWSHHARGSITRECEAMAGKVEHGSTRSELLETRVKRDNHDIAKIIDTVNNMVNPFEYEEDDLVNITSGTVATMDVQGDLETAHERGEAAFTAFAGERLQKGEMDFFAVMKKMKMKTFTDMSKAVKRRVHGKDITIKADRNLLARLVVIGRFRNINLQELLTYSLGPLPLALAKSDGSLVKTNKANLLHALESQPETSPVAETPIVGGVYIIDGMALLQQLNVNKLPGDRTFLNLALVILRRLVNRAKHNKSQEIHFVTDTYRQISIKNAERAKRAASGSQVMRIHGQSLPQQWKKFLSNGQNKESLVEYMDETWATVPTSELKGVKVFLAHGKMCHSFSPGKEANEPVVRVEEADLGSTHEEADTRIFLHASYAANTSANVIIESPDTDVFVIGISLQSVIPAHLYFHTGRGTKLRTIDLQTIRDSIGDVSQALIGLHCFTGCDSVSSLYGKGKKKALKLLLKETDLCQAFRDLGERFDLQPDIAAALEVFVCRLYGQQNITAVNEARYNMFRLQRKSEIAMPPNQDALMEHIKRANYQAGVYKRSLQADPDIPDPENHGWKMEDGELTINWMSLSPAPDSVMELAYCTGNCKKSKCGDAGICTCLQNNVPCTDLCKCARGNCSNITGHNEFDDSEDDHDDSEDEGSDNEEDDPVTDTVQL